MTAGLRPTARLAGWPKWTHKAAAVATALLILWAPAAAKTQTQHILGAAPRAVLREGVRATNRSATPVVLWHGMGDWAGSPAMQRLEALIANSTGAAVFSVQLGATASADRQASFMGGMLEQVDAVCELLRGDARVSDGFFGVGLSQGGLYLRALVERCSSGPRLRRLVTLGAPHGGVSAPPGCAEESLLCRAMQRAIEHAAYTGYVQSHIVQAQYYRNPEQPAAYLEHSTFLPIVNNEGGRGSALQARRLAALEVLALVQFANDTMVRPSDSAWFAYDAEGQRHVSLRETPGYAADALGLRSLDDRGSLRLLLWPGDHLAFDDARFTAEVTFPFLRG